MNSPPPAPRHTTPPQGQEHPSETRPQLHLATAGLIASGAALGAISRWILAHIIPGMPGLLLTNVLGCYLMGRLKPGPWGGTGFLGGFTSFGSFIALSAAHNAIIAAAYIIITVTTCVGAWIAGDHMRERSESATTDRTPR